MSSTVTTPVGFDALLVRGATWVLGVGGAWLALLLLAGLVEAASGGRVRGLAHVGCPAGWRPVLLAVLGGALAAVGATPAHATPTHADGPSSSSGDWLAVPARPVDAGAVRAAPLVVRAGDSLWSLARDRLGPDASDADLLRLTRSTYAANRGAIGPDPDVIHPGLRLRVPDPTGAHHP